MGTATLVRGWLPGEETERGVHPAFRDGQNDAVDERALFDSLSQLRDQLVTRKSTRVAMCRVGCRKGQSQWGVIKKLVETVSRATDITVAIYHPGVSAPGKAKVSEPHRD